jgi:hypothetical protein
LFGDGQTEHLLQLYQAMCQKGEEQHCVVG